MTNYLISGAEAGVARFALADAEASATSTWGSAVRYAGTPADGTYTITIQPVKDPEFSMRIDPDGESISTDGTEAQVAAVAVWARHILPAELPGELWLYNQPLSAHKLLDAGIGEADAWSGWVEH